jgi:hypothetical protein
LIGAIRRECLGYLVVFGEAHLRRILAPYAAYYNELHTHLRLAARSYRLFGHGHADAELAEALHHAQIA